ncbi:hypothetical protein JMJ55_05640 [Belnapia sp. T6]|uniref:DUF4148 domain-containing protein n=1 Tax=Belnapia mucosa TaxID=2804532 RepID=A0ABS1UZQ5_9PROT|nr:hypothetical protein [Belnapia mucosa]MBL6454797.1 hypothetical protein [Belnapia mucosa]
MAAILLLLAAGPALAQADTPPQRIGPEWDWHKHQPNPAEIEARARARNRPVATEQRQGAEVDRLYRDLTGQDPAAARVDARAADRR